MPSKGEIMHHDSTSTGQQRGQKEGGQVPIRLEPAQSQRLLPQKEGQASIPA
jgi:hypothetical protein